MDLRTALAGCLVLLLAGWAGAWWDEIQRAGWSTWLSVCRNGRPDPVTVFWTYGRLLPTSILAMLGTGLLLLGSAATTGHSAVARGSLAAHAACLVAMPLAIYGCALLAGVAAGSGSPLLAMAFTDLLLMLVMVPLFVALLRLAHGSGTRAVGTARG